MTTLDQAAGVTLAGFGWLAPGAIEPILDDITLDIHPGEAILITGHSGSGKTTLAHAIAGLLDEEDGEARGLLDIAGQPAKALPGKVGLVLQQPDDQTILHRVADDIVFGLENCGLHPELMPARISEALGQVGLNLPPESSTEHLSGGQRQRLALAGALAMRPSILVLDEPLQALDSEGKKQVLDAVTMLRENRSLTLVVVDHEPSYWLSTVDRVVTLKSGRLVSIQNAAGVVRTPRAEMVTPSTESPPRLVSDTVLRAVDLVIGHAGIALPGSHNLGVARGDIVAITGPNAAGKTTLALTLAGMLPRVSGTLTAPHLTTGTGSVSRSRTVAFVPQNPSHHHLESAVGKDIQASPLAQGRGAEEAEAIATKWAVRLGIAHLWNRHPQGLSGGEKRRVAIAAALSQNPDLIIFDEPTQSLDDMSWVAFVHLVREIALEGVAVIIVTHDLDCVRALGAAEYRCDAVTPDTRPATPEVPRAPWLAKANPVALIAASGVLALGLIITLDVVSALVAVLLIAGAAFFTKLPPAHVAKRLIPIGLAAFFSGVTIALYGREAGEVFFAWGLVVVSEGSIELAIATALRIIAIATPAVVLFTGIDATRLADGLAQLWRLPERFVIGALAAIRLVQLLGRDYTTLRQTRQSRGFGDVAWWRRIFTDVFTLLVVALRRADTLALAMEARGFGSDHPRSHFRTSIWRRGDTVIVVVASLIAAVAVGAAVVAGEFNAILW